MPLNWEIDNSSANWWRSVLFVGETGVSRGNRPHVRGVLNTTLGDKICQRLVVGRWLSLDTPVSSTNKTDLHDITEILLKVALTNITLHFCILIIELIVNNLNAIFLRLFLYFSEILGYIQVSLINNEDIISSFISSSSSVYRPGPSTLNEHMLLLTLWWWFQESSGVLY